MIRTTLTQANQFVLQKNYLATQKAGSLLSLTADIVGLPADAPALPFLAARARLADFRPEQLLTELRQRRTLIKGVLMRTGSYLVNTDRFASLHAATARQRNQAFNAEFRLWGLEKNEEIETVAEAVLSVVDDQALSAGEIAAQLPPALVRELTQTSRGGRVTKTSTVELALRWLAARGLLYAASDAPDWRAEETVYARLNHRYPDLDLSSAPGEAEAQKQLVRDYLAAFGPATEADISFWTGLGKSETARAIGSLSSETSLTLVEGIPGMLLILKQQAEALQAVGLPETPQVNLLPASDPFTMAHRASRARYFSDQKLQRQAFSSSGVAKPTILVNGSIVGVWDWQTEGAQAELTWQLITEVDPAVLSLIEAEIEQVTAFMTRD